MACTQAAILGGWTHRAHAVAQHVPAARASGFLRAAAVPPDAPGAGDTRSAEEIEDEEGDESSLLTDLSAAVPGVDHELRFEAAIEAEEAAEAARARARRRALAARVALTASYGCAVLLLLAAVPDLQQLTLSSPRHGVLAVTALLLVEAGTRALERARDSVAAAQRARVAFKVASELHRHEDATAAGVDAKRGERFARALLLSVPLEVLGGALAALLPNPATGVALLLAGSLPVRELEFVPEPGSGVMVQQSKRRRAYAACIDAFSMACVVAACVAPGGWAWAAVVGYLTNAVIAVSLSWEKDVEMPARPPTPLGLNVDMNK